MATEPAPSHEGNPLTPLRSLSGAVIAAGMAALLYELTTAVVQSLMAHPTRSNNTIILNLSAAVRTLVIGGMTLGTGIFALVALGLVGLGFQLAIQGWRVSRSERHSSEPPPSEIP